MAKKSILKNDLIYLKVRICLFKETRGAFLLNDNYKPYS